MLSIASKCQSINGRKESWLAGMRKQTESVPVSKQTKRGGELATGERDCVRERRDERASERARKEGTRMNEARGPQQ